MLHIILLILKIIGIVLLVVLGLILLVLLTTLLVPIRYRVLIEHGEAFYMKGRVNWLLHMLHANISHIEGILHIKVRVFGFVLYDNLKPRETKPRKKKANTHRGKNKKPLKTVNSKQDRPQVVSTEKKKAKNSKLDPLTGIENKNRKSGNEIVTMGRQKNGNKSNRIDTKKIDTISNIETNIEINKVANIEENIETNKETNIQANIEANIQTNIQTNIQENIQTNIQENIQENIQTNIQEIVPEKIPASQITKTEVKQENKQKTETTGTSEETQKDKTNILQKIVTRIKSMIERIRASLKELKSKIITWFTTLANIKNKMDLLSDFIKNGINREGFHITFASLKRLLKHILPTKLRSKLIFGTGDPCSTGQALGVLGVLYSFYGDKIQITPDFENSRFEGKHEARGRIRLVTILIIVVKLILDKRFKKLKRNFILLKEAL